MNLSILLVATVILLCVLVEKFSDKFGMPALIFFMFIGMLFGSDGILKIPFDDFRLAESVFSIALILSCFMVVLIQNGRLQSQLRQEFP